MNAIDMNIEQVAVLEPVALRARKAALKQQGATVYSRFGKRVLDVVIALAFLPLLAPIIFVLWVIVRSDGGPGFFGHRRLGHHGKAFRCWKIRSMGTDSQERLQEHLANNPEAAAEWARDQKLTKDPRITKIGHVLRATSLDELPQIWNILKGDMSFVGPRPVVRDEIPRYGADRTAYLSLKPGLTGLWQVSGRNDVSYDERVAMDVEYLQKHSLALDIKILFKTFGAVVNRTGS